jgi:tRNA threonylcarbamoyladenosine biosynthesis protein TsaE
MTEYMTEMRHTLPSEAETLALGGALAACIEPGLTIYLVGELGAGKTTLARGLLRGLGYAGKVRSPTFTLVEVYELSRLYLYHFDFYRFSDPQELGEAGFREYFNPQSVCLVEWPEKSNRAAGLPAADVRIVLAVAGSGRNVSVFADSEVGARCLRRLQARKFS